MWTRRLDQQKSLDAYLKRSFVGTGAGAGPPGHQYPCDEQSSGPAVIAAMAAACPPDELERRKYQLNTTQDHVQRHDDRKPQEAGGWRCLR